MVKYCLRRKAVNGIRVYQELTTFILNTREKDYDEMSKYLNGIRIWKDADKPMNNADNLKKKPMNNEDKPISNE